MYIKRVQEMRDTQKKTDSLARTLSPICVRGLKLVNGLTPMLLESGGYSYQDEYQLSNTGLNLKPQTANYDVDCEFRGQKEGEAKQKVKVTYSETLRVRGYILSISQKVKFK